MPPKAAKRGKGSGRGSGKKASPGKRAAAKRATPKRASPKKRQKSPGKKKGGSASPKRKPTKKAAARKSPGRKPAKRVTKKTPGRRQVVRRPAAVKPAPVAARASYITPESFLGGGKNGCVIKPAVPCADAAAMAKMSTVGDTSLPLVSKIARYNDLSRRPEETSPIPPELFEEVANGQILLRLDPQQKYFLGVLGPRCLTPVLTASDSDTLFSLCDEGRESSRGLDRRPQYAQVLVRYGGRSLESLMFRNDGEPQKDATEMGKYFDSFESFVVDYDNVFQGLQLLHGAGYVLVDLHWGNVVVHPRRIPHRVRLIDFSLMTRIDPLDPVLTPSYDLLGFLHLLWYVGTRIFSTGPKLASLLSRLEGLGKTGKVTAENLQTYQEILRTARSHL